MNRFPGRVWPMVVLSLVGCAHEPAKHERSAHEAESEVAPTGAKPPSSEPQPAVGLTVAGKPIEVLTAEELVLAVKAQGWLAPKDFPAAMAVMQRQDGGRESLTFVFDKQGVRLNVMIVRPIPGQKMSDESSVASAKSTYEAFKDKPAAMAGDSAIVVLDGAIGVPGASKAQMQQLFDALVKR